MIGQSSKGVAVRIVRGVHPELPEWVENLLHPEFKDAGPAEYDTTSLVSCFAPGQENGVTGDKVYTYLESNDLLSTCIDIVDLVEIRKKGIALFKRNWNGEVIFGWRSIVRSRDGNLGVPYIFGYKGSVGLHWHWTNNMWYNHYSAMRFAC